jgi:TP901 family phage tail tape measure protein
MPASIDLDIGGNTKRLDRDIRKSVNKVFEIDLKTKGEQPLGRITGKINEFNKSLDASNARVIAFGASAGIIFGIEKAFQSLVSSTIEVQKSLQDINVILNASSTELNKFGADLFNIAKNTGQSFEAVAKAATEFSRQGLGISETLKRTNEALILSRLSGLDAAKSVEALTAAVNSFASEAVTATEIVNKFANVDAAFAVSSADLADAISRVGSSAAQSGVSLNELIAIVTAAQQTTARGGAVIGNSFKTIFTRLQRTKVVDLLEGLGISTTDGTGQLKSTIALLQDLGSVYDKLGTLQQAEVAEKVGGVFQINILKSALADLGKEFSIYNNALKVAESTTDQAIRRNEELNKTYAAQLNALRENAVQLAAAAGERVIGPSFERVVGGGNLILENLNNVDSEGFGAKLGTGILDGIGKILAGPGIALIGGVLAKLFKDFSKFAIGSSKELLGLNNAAKQQADLQKSITSILSQNPQLLQLMQQGTQGVAKATEQLLASLRAQTTELQKQDILTAKIASQLFNRGVRVSEGIPNAPTPKTRADGYIPAFKKEQKDIQKRVGGAKPSDKPIGPFNINGEPTVINTGERLVENFGGSKETAILTREMQKGLSMALGYIPNFAVNPKTELYNLERKKTLTDQEKQRLSQLKYQIGKTQDNKVASPPIDLGSTDRLSLIYGKQTNSYKKIEASWKDKDGQFGARGQIYKARFNSSGFNPKEAIEPEDQDLARGIGDYIVDYTNRYVSFFGNKSSLARIKDVSELSNLGSLPSIAGTVFETAVTKGTNSVMAQSSREGGASAVIDFINPNQELRSLFNNTPGDYEAKISESLAPDVIRKGLKENIFRVPKMKSRSKGFIPNFSNALKDAIIRETNESGLPNNKIYVANNKDLVSKSNPFGLGVFNSRDEGTKSKENKAVKSKSTGYIPNFAEQADFGSIGAVLTQLALLSIGFRSFNSEFNSEIDKIRSSISIRKEELSSLDKNSKQFRKLEAQISKSETSLGKLEKIAGSSGVAGTFKRIFSGAGIKAGLSSGGALGLTSAPIIAETIANSIGRNNPEDRRTGAAVSALGQTASFAGAGFLVGGPIGAAVGGVAGGLLSLGPLLDELNSNFPELSSAAEKSRESLQNFSDSSSKFLTASENYQKLLEDGADLDTVNKARKALNESLNGVSEEEKKSILSSKSLSEAREKIAKILQNKQVVTEFTSNLQDVGKILGQERSNANIRNVSGGLFGSGLLENDSKELEKLNKTLQSIFFQGLDERSGLGKINAVGGGQGFSSNINSSQDFAEAFASGLPDTEEVRSLKNELATIPFDSLSVIVKTFAAGLDNSKKSFEDSITAQKNYDDSIRNLSKSRAFENQLLEKTKDSIRKNIEITQAYISSIEQSKLALQQFSQNRIIEQNFSNKREAASQITGEGSRIATQYQIAEDILKNSNDRINSIQNRNLDFQNQVSTLLGSAFEDVRKKIIDQASGENLSPKQISTNRLQLESQNLKLESSFKNSNTLLGKALGEQIDTQNLLRGLKTYLISAGVENVNSILTNIEILAEKTNNELISINQQEKLANKSLADRATQNLVLKTLQSATGIFGGAESFLSPQKDEFGNEITPLKSLDSFVNEIKGIESKSAFRYNNKESVNARVADIPDLGRNYLSLIKTLQTLSGGLYEVDPQSDSYQKAMAGLTQDISNKIKEFEKALRDDAISRQNTGRAILPDDVRQEYRSFVDALKQFNPKEIAALQMGQATGQIDSSVFNSIFSKIYKNSIGQIEKINLQVAEAIKSGLSISDDPLVNQASLQTQIQTQQFGVLQNIDKSIISLAQIMSQRAGSENNLQPYSPPKGPVKNKASGYIPAFKNETSAINKGIGGALPSDYPVFLNDLNGKPAMINSGEKLIKNFGGTRKTAVLTRDMQKAFNFAKGLIPNFARIPKDPGFEKTIRQLVESGTFNTLEDSAAFLEGIFEMDKQAGTNSTPAEIYKKAIQEAEGVSKVNKNLALEQSMDTKADKLKRMVDFGTPEEQAVARKKLAKINPEKIAPIDKPISQLESDSVKKGIADAEKPKPETKKVPTPKPEDPIKKAEREALEFLDRNKKNTTTPGKVGSRGRTGGISQKSQLYNWLKSKGYSDDLAKKTVEQAFQNKAASKATSKVVEEAAEATTKSAAKTAGKAGGKGLGKAILKKIPIIGIGAGIGFGISRAMEGDFAGAGLEVVSGVAGSFPGIGTGISAAIDTGLTVRDIASSTTENPESVVNNNAAMPAIITANQNQPAPASVIPTPASKPVSSAKNTVSQPSSSSDTKKTKPTIPENIYRIIENANRSEDAGKVGEARKQYELAKKQLEEYSGTQIPKEIADFSSTVLNEIKESQSRMKQKAVGEIDTKTSRPKSVVEGLYPSEQFSEDEMASFIRNIQDSLTEIKKSEFQDKSYSEARNKIKSLKQTLEKYGSEDSSYKLTPAGKRWLTEGLYATQVISDRVRQKSTGILDPDATNPLPKEEESKAPVLERKPSEKVASLLNTKSDTSSNADPVRSVIESTQKENAYSDETAKAEVLELNTAYEDAIKNAKTSEEKMALAKKLMEYKTMYSRQQYSKLRTVYNSHKKTDSYSKGFIPNFFEKNPLNDSIQREVASLVSMGASPSEALNSVRVGSSGLLKSATNPLGLGVFNKLQGQNSLSQAFRDHAGENLKMSGMNFEKRVPNFSNLDSGLNNIVSAFDSLSENNIPNNNISIMLESLNSAIEKLTGAASNFVPNFAAGMTSNVKADINAPVNLNITSAQQDPREVILSMLPEINDQIGNNVKRALGKKVPPSLARI